MPTRQARSLTATVSILFYFLYNHRILIKQYLSGNNGVKSEPTDIISTELGAESDADNSGEEGGGSGTGGTDGLGGDEGGGGGGGGDSKSSAASFLHDSKLFQQGQGSYNFTLAALADPGLSGRRLS